MIKSTSIYIPHSPFSVAEVASKTSWMLLSPFYIWIASCFCCFLQILDPQESRQECYHAPLAVPHADCLQMSAICLSHCPANGEAAAQSALRRAGLPPSAGSCKQKENVWRAPVPKTGPKGIYFKQTIWCKDILNSSGYSLKWKQVEIRDCMWIVHQCRPVQ